MPTEDDADSNGLVLILRKGGAIREASYDGIAFNQVERERLLVVTHWARMLPKPKE